MARQFLTPIDLLQNEIRNGVTQVLATAPTSPAPKVGQKYYNSAILAEFSYNGTAWVVQDATKSTGIPLSALATDPLARANHTGTQVAATISNLAGTVQAYSLSLFAVPTANIPMGGFTLTGLSTTPNAAGQAAEYSWVLGQVQSAAAGITSRPPVRVIAQTNITLSGTQTIDGIACIAGDRVLAAAQTTASANGVYVVAAGAWARATSEDASNEMTAGAMWLVTEGSTGAGTQWRQATTGAIVLGTTALSILQFGATTPYTAGNGITLTGSSFSVNPAASGGISVAGGGVSLDTAIAVRKYATTIGDGSTLSFTVTHNLGTQDVCMQVRQVANPYGIVECDMSATTTNTATIAFATAPAASAYRVVVHG
jgi:hypothetical protein